MDRTIRSAQAKPSITLYDANGDPASAGGAVTAAVKLSDGSAVTGSPFSAVESPTGVYTITIPAAAVGVLDRYDVEWDLPGDDARTTQFEVVGSFLFGVAELRAFDAMLASKTAAEVRVWREAVEERFESAAKVSFTLRGRRAYLHGHGTCELILPDVEVRSIVAIKVDGAALSSGDLANMKLEPWGQLVWDGGTFASGIRNVEVLYEHGFLTAPEPVRRAGLKLAKSLALVSAMEQSERATAVFTDVGGYRLSIAGRDGPTGLPEVDAVLEQYGRMPAGGLA